MTRAQPGQRRRKPVGLGGWEPPRVCLASNTWSKSPQLSAHWGRAADVWWGDWLAGGQGSVSPAGGPVRLRSIVATRESGPSVARFFKISRKARYLVFTLKSLMREVLRVGSGPHGGLGSRAGQLHQRGGWRVASLPIQRLTGCSDCPWVACSFAGGIRPRPDLSSVLGRREDFLGPRAVRGLGLLR